MCGFTGGQADTLRKAIGKKIPEVMAKMKDAFIEGGIENSGADRKLMEKFWKQLEEFAAYCFNKSHAACYGLIAYQTAFLKAHYPVAFMAALMTSDYDNTDRLAIEITECKHMGIQVLPPDVNQSFHEFAVVPGQDQIRFGLDAVKNVGHSAADEIIRAREETGQFVKVEDFFKQVNLRIANRKSIESLIKAGAFDSLENRSRLLANIDSLMSFGTKFQKEQSSGQVDLFGNDISSDVQTSINWVDNQEQIGSKELLVWERELLGLYLSHHPLEQFEKILAAQTTPISRLLPEMDGKQVTVGGSLLDIREITTKNGSKMAFVKIADNTGEMELVVFPGIFKDIAPILQRDSVVMTKGKLSSKGRDGATSDEVKLLVDELREISSEEAKDYHTNISVRANLDVAAPNSLVDNRVYIRLKSGQDENLLLALKHELDNHIGQTEVVLVTGHKNAKQIIRLPQKIEASENALDSLSEIFGQANVVYR
jgi:DNA polymerase-3 subunit alpha